MIRALVFDWGGVLQRTEDYGPRHALDAELGLTPGSVERAVFGHPLWARASMGLAGADELWTTIAGELRWPVARTDEFVRRFFAGDRIDERLMGLIRWYRHSGLRIALLSNAPPPYSAPGGGARWGMDGLFDVQVFSYQVGALKPDRRMFDRVLAALSLAASEALFVDDALANVEGARLVGMEAVFFAGLESLVQSLREHGLHIPEEAVGREVVGSALSRH